jgi:hypothetical protein
MDSPEVEPPNPPRTPNPNKIFGLNLAALAALAVKPLDFSETS